MVAQARESLAKTVSVICTVPDLLYKGSEDEKARCATSVVCRSSAGTIE